MYLEETFGEKEIAVTETVPLDLHLLQVPYVLLLRNGKKDVSNGKWDVSNGKSDASNGK